jgi:hypothetical protein
MSRSAVTLAVTTTHFGQVNQRPNKRLKLLKTAVSPLGVGTPQIDSTNARINCDRFWAAALMGPGSSIDIGGKCRYIPGKYLSGKLSCKSG